LYSSQVRLVRGWLVRRLRRLILLTVGLGLASGLALAQSHDDLARYLAGLEPVRGSALESLSIEPAWREHAEQINAAWKRLESTQLSQVREWSAIHLRAPTDTLLYFFSGPDYLYARNFFPHARIYLLAGLEAPGVLPSVASMSADDRQVGLENLRQSIRSLLRASFFITADMRKDLHGQGFLGVVPVFYVFLARSGMEIRDLKYLALREQGDVEEVVAPSPSRPAGLQIKFFDPQASTERTLVYFSIDLSNAGLKGGAFLKFLERRGPADALIKSASYLLHTTGFTRLRDFLLEQSVTIVQDDTGIRLDDYDTEKWSVRPFGRYARPIPSFETMYQPSMARLFQEGAPEALKFRLGYGFSVDTTALLLATRRVPNK
jgi:hypothetical protein